MLVRPAPLLVHRPSKIQQGRVISHIGAPVTLAEDLKNLPRRHRTFDGWLAANPDRAEMVLAAVRDCDIEVAALLRTLRAHGIPMTHQTVKAYRDAR